MNFNSQRLSKGLLLALVTTNLILAPTSAFLITTNNNGRLLRAAIVRNHHGQTTTNQMLANLAILKKAYKNQNQRQRPLGLKRRVLILFDSTMKMKTWVQYILFGLLVVLLLGLIVGIALFSTNKAGPVEMNDKTWATYAKTLKMSPAPNGAPGQNPQQRMPQNPNESHMHLNNMSMQSNMGGGQQGMGGMGGMGGRQPMRGMNPPMGNNGQMMPGSRM